MGDSRRKVLLISLDALANSELDIIMQMPNLSRIIKEGVFGNQLISVYPTQTYTVHATVATGSYPDKHGVYNNQQFQPFVESKQKTWFWYRDQIQSPTIYDVARENGLKVGSLLWPTTGRARMRYNLPEVLAIGRENQVLKVLRSGTPASILRLEAKYGRTRESYSQPHLDGFVTKCAVDILSKKKPDLMMVHMVCVDAAKHEYSVESDEVAQAVEYMDSNIGQMIDACGDEYSIVLFSDHGQFSIHYTVYINAFLHQHGMLDFDTKQYNAYVECTGGSGILRAKTDEYMIRAQQLIWDNMDDLGIESIYDRDQLDQLHVHQDIQCMVECRAGYQLVDGDSSTVVHSLESEHIRHGDHGYNPNKDGYECLFFAIGSDICRGKRIGKISMTDIAPTVCQMLAIQMPECDGSVIEDIFVQKKAVAKS